MPTNSYDCEKCGAEITLYPGQRGVFCRQCGAEQLHAPGAAGEPTDSYDSNQPSSDLSADETSRRDRLIPIPASLDISDDGASLTIKRRWFTPAILFLVFFCIAWDSFLVFWYSMAFGDDAPWLMIVFPIAHVAVGIGLTYFTVASLFNTTTIRVQRHELTVSHGPIPWIGNHRVSTSRIRQLYCKEKRNLHNNDSSPGHVVTTYEVYLVFEDRKNLKLASSLSAIEEALAIEQAVEQYLDLPDEPVAGEVKA
ncbi:MAG: hypothetical protein AAF589_07865 [Planctomycetota bacterium]